MRLAGLAAMLAMGSLGFGGYGPRDYDRDDDRPRVRRPSGPREFYTSERPLSKRAKRRARGRV